MGEGRILQMDSPRQIYERPKNREVADFIGQMNLLSGAVESVGDKVTVNTPTLGNVCVESNDQDVVVGDAVTLGYPTGKPETAIDVSARAVRVTSGGQRIWGIPPITGGRDRAEGESLDVAQQDYSGSERGTRRGWGLIQRISCCSKTSRLTRF